MNILIKRLLSQERSWQKPYGTKEPTKRINVDRQKRSYLYRFTVHITNIQQEINEQFQLEQRKFKSIQTHQEHCSKFHRKSMACAQMHTHTCIAWIEKKERLKREKEWQQKSQNYLQIFLLHVSYFSYTVCSLLEKIIDNHCVAAWCVCILFLSFFSCV